MRSSFVIVQIIMVALVPGLSRAELFHRRAAGAGDYFAAGQAGGRRASARARPCIWAFPAPIDEVVKLRITSLDDGRFFGRLVSDAGPNEGRGAHRFEPPPMSKLNPANITYALTADTNIIHVKATAASTRITDPTVFHFQFCQCARLHHQRAR